MITTDITYGRILHLQRLSTEDGPGIRTTVFFKGCPLHCAWCHNPESISTHFQVQWLENRCIGCNTCQGACPESALLRLPDGIQINRQLCSGCGDCAARCPTNALEMMGVRIDADHLTAELLKDRVYFEKSGGGVTLSGGEPALQPAFALAVLAQLRAAGVQTALDTCGLCQPSTLEALVQAVDLVLFDLKLMDPDQHRFYTGQDNHLILENLARLADCCRRSTGPQLWVRTPLIPGATDSPENIRSIGRYLQETAGDVLERWEICAFNNLCRDKYSRLGLEWDYSAVPLYSKEALETVQIMARSAGLPPERVMVTGAAQSKK